MNYETYSPSADLASFVKCYWTLEGLVDNATQKQRVLPDGCIELFFILGDDVRRFVSETEFVIQPRSMVLGQITEPYYIQPTGQVNCFAVRFYPYGFANFVQTSIVNLANTETPIELLFGDETAAYISKQIINAANTQDRIALIEAFLLERINDSASRNRIVESTIEALLLANGSTAINAILKNDLSRRRKLERLFTRQIGISPKQLGKVIRLQAVLKTLLSRQSGDLIQIAYDHDYYDQAHFIKDFKELTGTSPGRFLADDTMALSTLLYSVG
ncbi:helix-turn-helix domain-containing protein [Dyadobacter chenwenxiniae]|uniref:Helix-turn-helix domain-containing protein n=1 Tax=Dyadobacter chenwenxiniae TaxID=2906456 RepID=A0A9X1PS88_9BACT|nr:helix-turn-helix domain-containing protein [Dyadobacter chenwenxiniae]MCF0064713.1 helix-turn-helix domain-containing protein [Dyadobacter chenwenxiniae]UON84233.1 helix-turn-helix domain-containing protein [Dyadobacter chenwenxiniae]